MNITMLISDLENGINLKHTKIDDMQIINKKIKKSLHH